MKGRDIQVYVMDLSKYEANFLFAKDIDQELGEMYPIDKTNIFCMLTTKIMKLNLIERSLINMNFLYIEGNEYVEVPNVTALYFSDSIVFTDKYFGFVGTQGGKLYVCNEDKENQDKEEKTGCEFIKTFNIEQVVNIYVNFLLIKG